MVRPRPPGDDAYRQTDFSALLASWDAEPTQLVEVLLGLRLAIVIPEGDCDPEGMEECRGVAETASQVAPAILGREEVEDYLTTQQERDLDNGDPVLFHCLVDRERVSTRGRPRLTDRINRVNDARQFMIAQALLHLGHLVAKKPLSGGRQAFDEIERKVTGDWWPDGVPGRQNPDALYGRLLKAFDAGNHFSVYGKFLPAGTIAIKQVTEHYHQLDFAGIDIEERKAFWLTVLRAGLLVEGLAERQAAAQINLNRTPLGQDYNRTDIMGFIGATGPRPSVDDLLPVAFFGVPDLGHVARWMSAQQNLFECAAAIGEISRGERARLSHWQATLLLTALESIPNATGSPYLDKFAFLRTAMTMVRDAGWWRRVLTSSQVNNYNCRHIALGDAAGLTVAEFLGRDKEPYPLELSTPLTFELMRVARAMRHQTIHLLEAHPSLHLFGRVDSGEMWIDLTQHGRFEGDAPLWFEDSVAQCLSQLALERLEGRSLHLRQPTSPYCFEDHIAVAVATVEMLEFVGGTPLPQHQLDIRTYARWLSDDETRQAMQRGKMAVADILLRLEQDADW